MHQVEANGGISPEQYSCHKGMLDSEKSLNKLLLFEIFY